MKIQKVNKYFNIFFVISLICIFISSVLIVYSSLFGKMYLAVNNKNRDTIIKMLEESEEISKSSEIIINDDIVRIGKMQGLGDWYLYIKYNNGEEKNIILDDGELGELYEYIGSNGSTLGILTNFLKTTSIIAIIFIPIYITFKICYAINRTTERIIQQDKE